MTDETNEPSGESTPTAPLIPPPVLPHGWVSVALGLGAGLIALAVAVFLAAQYLDSRPLDLRAETMAAAEDVQAKLFSNRVPEKNLTAHTELVETARASYHYIEYDVILPASIDPEGVQKLLRRSLLKQGVVVGRSTGAAGEPILELSLARQPFGYVRIQPSRASGSWRGAWPELDVPEPAREAPAVSSPKVMLEAPVSVEPETVEEMPTADPEEGSESRPVEPIADEPVGIALPISEDEPSEMEEASQDMAESEEVTRVAVWAPPDAATPSAEEIGAPVVHRGLMRVAIIVDDGGYGGETTERILALDPGLTLAILPYTPKARETARRAVERGFEVILHMPMENLDENLRHDGQLDVGMSSAKIHALTLRALDYVPGAVGINNHMGSRYTADAFYMKLFLERLTDKPLYFVDSRTSSMSVAYDLALEAGIPAARRHIFLDHDNNPDAIRASFDKMIAMTEERGQIVAIAHFRPNTVMVLEEKLPDLDGAGIDLVHASALVQ